MTGDRHLFRNRAGLKVLTHHCCWGMMVVLASVPLDIIAEPTGDEWSREKKVLVSNISGAALVITWGAFNWDYGARNPHFRSESWFARDTKHGGADKIGHTYAVYGVSHMLSHYYEKWGYSQTVAARYGAYSGLFIHTIMEFGDSFSGFGFSYQDYVMNMLGAYLGYYLYKQPERNRYIDLRVEYIPTFTKPDIFTDYHGIKYMAAFKLDAFERLRRGVMKYVEIQAGYYARGYERVKTAKERNIYVAVGMNILRLFNKSAARDRRPALLSYYQVPYVYIPAVRDLNQ